MSDLYLIFGCINYFEDKAGETRGLRKRPIETWIFVVEGEIELVIGDNLFFVRKGEEFRILSDRWHGWKAIKDSKILQRLIGTYDPHAERRRLFEVPKRHS